MQIGLSPLRSLAVELDYQDSIMGRPAPKHACADTERERERGGGWKWKNGGEALKRHRIEISRTRRRDFEDKILIY